MVVAGNGRSRSAFGNDGMKLAVYDYSPRFRPVDDTGLGIMGWDDILLAVGTMYLNKKSSDKQAATQKEIAQKQLDAQVAMQEKALAAEQAAQKAAQAQYQLMLQQAGTQLTQPSYTSQPTVTNTQPIVIQQPGQAPQTVYIPSGFQFAPWMMYAALGGVGLITLAFVITRRKGKRK